METEEETEEIIEKTEIVKTLIHKFKTEGKIMTLTARTVEQLDANDFENHLGETPRTTDLHPDELDLLCAYRVMNELGKSCLIYLLHNINTESCKAKMENVASPKWRKLQTLLSNLPISATSVFGSHKRSIADIF